MSFGFLIENIIWKLNDLNNEIRELREKNSRLNLDDVVAEKNIKIQILEEKISNQEEKISALKKLL